MLCPTYGAHDIVYYVKCNIPFTCYHVHVKRMWHSCDTSRPQHVAHMTWYVTCTPHIIIYMLGACGIHVKCHATTCGAHDMLLHATCPPYATIWYACYYICVSNQCNYPCFIYTYQTIKSTIKILAQDNCNQYQFCTEYYYAIEHCSTFVLKPKFTNFVKG